MRIPLSVKKRLANATFKIHSKSAGNGQCVLIDDGLLLTAAHCVDWNCLTMANSGEYHLAKVNARGSAFVANVCAIEPCSDTAVLGCPDNEIFHREAQVFQELCDGIAPVKLSQDTPKPFERFPVWTLTHHGAWISGMALYGIAESQFSFETLCEVPDGTSGGPIVNCRGELVGVVSYGTTRPANKKFTSSAGFLPLALPGWVFARLRTA